MTRGWPKLTHHFNGFSFKLTHFSWGKNTSIHTYIFLLDFISTSGWPVFTGKNYLFPYPYFSFKFIYVIEFGYNFAQSMSRSVILDSLIPTLFIYFLRNKHTHNREGKEIKLTFFISNVLFGRLTLLWFVWK